jgi:hypothetical protein
MDQPYKALQNRARELATTLPEPDFYQQFKDFHRFSRQFLESNPTLKELHRFVSQTIESDFGHGMCHAFKVSADAGVLVLIAGQCGIYKESGRHRALLLTQSAGLLHDIKRKEKNHARKGSLYAKTVLKNYPFTYKEAEDICLAIRNHEAFKPTLPCRSPLGHIISDCLYDADKFRWGPDNFTDTIWEMLTCLKIPPADFVRLYPQGIQNLERIKPTFRTPTGKKFGPQMIDMGIHIGNVLMTEVEAGILDG